MEHHYVQFAGFSVDAIDHILQVATCGFGGQRAVHLYVMSSKMINVLDVLLLLLASGIEVCGAHHILVCFVCETGIDVIHAGPCAKLACHISMSCIVAQLCCINLSNSPVKVST